MKVKNHLEYWQAVGVYFGFPQCCIDNFLSRADDCSTTRNQDMVCDGSGFVPCDECAKSIIKSGLPLSSLISNRIHSAPFPNMIEKEFKEFKSKIGANEIGLYIKNY